MVVLLLFIMVFIVITTAFSAIKLSLKKEKADSRDDSYGDDYYDLKERILKFRPLTYIVFFAVTILVSIFQGIYFTNEQEIGFISVFGINTPIDGPGMHFKLPFISEKHIYDATTQGMPIGYVEGTEQTITEESMMITSDFNFVNIDFYIEYRITDPIEYCYGSNDPKSVFYNIAQAAIRNTVGMYDVDSVMTTGKPEIESHVFDDIITELGKHHTGLTVVNVTIQDVESPTPQVASAFMEVSDAKSNAETYVNEANAYKNTQTPAAEAKSEQIKQAATAAKTERVNAAKEEVAKFEALFTEYENNPETVKMRLYYAAMQDILPNMEVIIGKDAKVIYVKSGEGEVKVPENSSPASSTDDQQ